MPNKIRPFILFLGGITLMFAAAGFLLFPDQVVEAQCGTQASSCKNCHEVQGELPVNNDGTGWHESHAFGDFCYVCHAGNQQATEKADAHTGMVPPLSDIKASCQMCHAADLDERAQVYATVLNVDLNGGSGDSGSSDESSGSSADDFWGEAPAATSAPAAEDFWGGESTSAESAPAEPTTVTIAPVDQELFVNDPNLVDYVQRYDEIVLGKRPVNWGNIALIGLIGLVLVGGGGFVIFNEMRLRTSLGEFEKVEGEYPADVIEMLPAITRLQFQTRKTLRKILDNPGKADKVLALVDSVASDDQVKE
ncbi:MAG: hypothetical protein K8L99_34660 [Anaerolineae bacterium]|nr:hypothetical protein [Anaerolineae bacterium]